MAGQEESEVQDTYNLFGNEAVSKIESAQGEKGEIEGVFDRSLS